MASFSVEPHPLPGAHGLRVVQRGRAATVGEVLAAWPDDPRAREAILRALAEAPFEAFFWELPATSPASLGRPFVCALVDAPALAAARPDPGPFAEHFVHAEPGEPVVVFDNIGGDARLVAPCPGDDPAACAHLAAFVRRAAGRRPHALLEAVARAMADRLAERTDPVWLSTSGTGVSWLHVRLDDRPKYYQHAPFRAPPPGGVA